MSLEVTTNLAEFVDIGSPIHGLYSHATGVLLDEKGVSHPPPNINLYPTTGDTRVFVTGFSPSVTRDSLAVTMDDAKGLSWTPTRMYGGVFNGGSIHRNLEWLYTPDGDSIVLCRAAFNISTSEVTLTFLTFGEFGVDPAIVQSFTHSVGVATLTGNLYLETSNDGSKALFSFWSPFVSLIGGMFECAVLVSLSGDQPSISATVTTHYNGTGTRPSVANGRLIESGAETSMYKWVRIVDDGGGGSVKTTGVVASTSSAPDDSIVVGLIGRTTSSETIGLGQVRGAFLDAAGGVQAISFNFSQSFVYVGDCDANVGGPVSFSASTTTVESMSWKVGGVTLFEASGSGSGNGSWIGSHLADTSPAVSMSVSGSFDGYAFDPYSTVGRNPLNFSISTTPRNIVSFDLDTRMMDPINDPGSGNSTWNVLKYVFRRAANKVAILTRYDANWSTTGHPSTNTTYGIGLGIPTSVQVKVAMPGELPYIFGSADLVGNKVELGQNIVCFI